MKRDQRCRVAVGNAIFDRDTRLDEARLAADQKHYGKQLELTRQLR